MPSITLKVKRKYTKRGAASTAKLSEITEEASTISYEPPRSSSNFELDEMLPTTSAAAASSAAKGAEKRFNWYDAVPRMEDIARRKSEFARPHTDPQASYVMNIRERKVLALPYVDIGLPDFLEYQFPEPEQFIAKLKFD